MLSIKPRRLLCSLLFLLSLDCWAEELYSPVHTYQVENELGTGRRAHVHAAFDEQGHLYALKKLYTKREVRENGSSSNELKRLYDAEGFAVNGVRAYRNGKQFKHPNIIKSYEIILQDKRTWVVMEYVPGQTVAAVEHRSLNKHAAHGMGLQFLDVLEYITMQGFYHGDLFGQNFMISDQLELKAIDLDGIKRLNGKDSSGHNKRIEEYFRMVHVILWEILNTGAFTDQELEELRNQFKALAAHSKFKKIQEERTSLPYTSLIFDYFYGLRQIMNGQDIFAEWAVTRKHGSSRSQKRTSKRYWR